MERLTLLKIAEAKKWEKVELNPYLYNSIIITFLIILIFLLYNLIYIITCINV